MPDRPTDAELAAALRVLRAIADDRGVLAGVDEGVRRALLEAAGRVSRPDKHERVRLSKALRRRDRVEQKAHDARVVFATGIRAGQGAALLAAPGEPVVDRPDDEATPGGPELLEPRNCYVCKVAFRRVHFFYDSMCPPCAALNWKKRSQTARLDGRVAVITGARLKIGYQAALQMLRAGARVIATTRFPRDAARRYAAEPDFAEWGERLELHGLDLRHAPSVELFARHLESRLGRLDILANNAAQTVRRPPGFYAHLLDGEERPLEAETPAVRRLVGAHEALVAELRGAALPAHEELGLVTWQGGAPGVGVWGSARLSQVPCAPGDDTTLAFPAGRLDGDLQQVDLRPVNSWRLPLDQVPTAELLEVHLVNAVAPFLLCARLRPLLERSPEPLRFIVNVSAMEGVYSRKKKTENHPHTNMAKAALNMLTRTSAQDYVKSGIHMNSVDTGWITDEDPLRHVERKQVVHGFHPPLDALDGAARVLDPIFEGIRTGAPAWGKFFKDYAPADW